MPTYKVINDLQCSFYEAGFISEKPIVKIITRSNPDPVYFWPDELHPLGEWLIKCADEIGNPGYIVPFTGDTEQAGRESAADAAQVEREMAFYAPTEEELDEILATGEIPYLGEPITYETDDNISPEAIGLSEPF